MTCSYCKTLANQLVMYLTISTDDTVANPQQDQSPPGYGVQQYPPAVAPVPHTQPVEVN